MATPGQLSVLERDRTSRLRAARGPELNLPRASQRPAPAEDGPVFGEEGFGDPEASRSRRPTEEQPAEEEVTGGASQELEEDQIQRIRAQAQEDQREEAEQEIQIQEEPLPGGLSPADQLARDQIDVMVNAVCYFIPVVLHFLWWNVRMVYGSWIAGGNSRYIGPFGWSDIAMVFLPGGKMTGSELAGKTTALILPDFVAQLSLLFLDLWIMTAVALSIVVQIILIYLLYTVITDPIAAFDQFGSLISSFL